MKGFYHIWAWRPSWSCDLDFLYTHWFPLPIDASYKIWLWLAKRFQRRRSLKLWTDRRTTDGRTTDHGHPISSPCEPNGSGELIMIRLQTLIMKSTLLTVPTVSLLQFVSDTARCSVLNMPMQCVTQLNQMMIFEPVCEKTNKLGFDQVRHKPGCSVTDNGKRLEILDLESRGIVLSVSRKQRR